jgi:hypothetical protein
MKTQKFITFHGDPKLKAERIARVRAHREADNLVKSRTGQDRKGCAVWCTLNKYERSAYETEMGIPRILAHVQDRAFEGLNNKESQAWPEQFLEAIPVGADLSMVWPQFAHWLLVDEKDGVIKYANKESTKQAIQAVADLYQSWIKTGVRPRKTKWLKARDAANATLVTINYPVILANIVTNTVTGVAVNLTKTVHEVDAAARAVYFAADAATYNIYHTYNGHNAYDVSLRTREQAYSIQAKKLLELLAAAPIYPDFKIKNK